MIQLIDFVYLWATNTILLHVSNMVYPTSFVLGNATYSVTAAALRAGAVWTLLYVLAGPAKKALKFKLPDNSKAIYFLAINFAALWITTRFALIIGFGVISFWWLLGLAFVANIFQFTLRKMLKRDN